MGSLPAFAALCNGFGHEQAIAEYIFAALLGRPVPLISGNSLTGFSLLDWLALIVFGFGWLGYELVMNRTAVRRRSLNVAMREQRHHWMQTMALVDNRIMDSSAHESLQNGTAFFASTALIAIGGALTLFAFVDDVRLLVS